MTVVLQQAVSPARAAAYLAGYDRVSGYVVRAAEVSAVTDLAGLRHLHGLDAGTGAVYILHVDTSPSWSLLAAGDRLDLPGATVEGRHVPRFFLNHTRLTPGARLWRFEADSAPVRVGTFRGVAHGWLDHTRGTVAAPQPSLDVGPAVVLAGTAYVADVVSGDDGVPVAITAVSALEPPVSLGFARNPFGHWTRPVQLHEAEALFDLTVAGTWRDHPVQLVQQTRTGDGRIAVRVCSLAPHQAAELGFQEVEPGGWEATVPAEQIRDAAPREITPRAWLTAQREQLARVEARADLNTPPHEHFRRIAHSIIPHIPSGTAEVQVLCEALGDVLEVSAQAILDGDSPVALHLPLAVAQSLSEARTLSGGEGGDGPWFGVFLRITATGEVTVHFNREDRPRLEITADMVRVERERFPRPRYPRWFEEQERALHEMPRHT